MDKPAAEVVRLTESGALMLREYFAEYSAKNYHTIAALEAIATGATACVVNRAEAERRLLEQHCEPTDLCEVQEILDAIYGSEK